MCKISQTRDVSVEHHASPLTHAAPRNKQLQARNKHIKHTDNKQLMKTSKQNAPSNIFNSWTQNMNEKEIKTFSLNGHRTPFVQLTILFTVKTSSVNRQI